MLAGAMAGHAATDSVLMAHRARWEALDPCLPDSYRSTLVTGPPCASVGTRWAAAALHLPCAPGTAGTNREPISALCDDILT
jgi:hypothetical protein